MTDKKNPERVDAEAREAVADEVADATPFEKNPLWQSGNVSTNEPGPRVEDVSPVFAQARADALGAAVEAVESGDRVPENVILPEDGADKTNEEAIADLKESHRAAKADAKDAEEGNGLLVEVSDGSSEANAKSDADKADESKKASDGHK